MKKSIFKRIGLIALAVCVAIGSFFVPITKKQYNSASAISNDSSEIGYQFDASNILLFETLVDTGNGRANPRFLSFDIEIITTLIDGTSIAFNAEQYAYDGNNIVMPAPFYPYDPLTGETSKFFTRDSFDAGYSINLFRSDNEYFTLPLFLKTDPGFIANCKAVHIFTSPLGTYLGDNFNPSIVTFSSAVMNIEYIDFNDNILLIQFLSPTYFTDLYDERTYYFMANYTDNDFYNQGFRDGLADNQTNIYNNGYTAGYDVGFDQGRQNGIIEANDYSFISLIGSVIDVPVQTFMGLLNFTFLDINLFDFICAILTFLLIIFVVKLFIGGK